MGYIDEGYIKFNCDWKTAPLSFSNDDLKTLLQVRDALHEKHLIGFDAHHKVGFGNISTRIENTLEFVVSGTQTGHLFPAKLEDFTVVNRFDIDQNKVWCEGPVKASSESLTHAAVYQFDPNVKAIIHVHHSGLWKRLLEIPASGPNVPYGTPEMAYEIERLFKEERFGETKIMAMAGHTDGVIAIGKDLQEAFDTLMAWF